MKLSDATVRCIAVSSLLFCCALELLSQDRSEPGTVQVHVVVTDAALQDDKEVPPLQREDVKVKQGKKFLQVTKVIPAEGQAAALQLMILIDDALNTSIGNHLNDIKEFIAAQPQSTIIGIAYMSNPGINVAQNFTADHDLAAKAVRLPRGSLSTMDSPYLSLISLVKGWQQQKVRRVVLMVTDGIDRLRGERPEPTKLGPRYDMVYHSMPSISNDANSASEAAQRSNVLVYPLYAAGIGRAGRSSWDLQLGLGGLSKIAEETGGECFSLGTTTPVSFKPYIERFQKMLGNQYYVVFQATPKKKAGFQRINIDTELPNSQILAPDNVWVQSTGH